ALTGPKSDLAKTMVNAERFTSKLANNSDIDTTLRNFRTASGNLNRTVSGLGTQFSAIGSNLEQATDTVKRQPWRLIWPSTKKYNDAEDKPAEQTSSRQDPSQRSTKRPRSKQRESDEKPAVRRGQGKSS
ncbi:MAG TPA: hypothetical protein VF614_16110, partial [Chthoniobacteraceae bacterium]